MPIPGAPKSVWRREGMLVRRGEADAPPLGRDCDGFGARGVCGQRPTRPGSRRCTDRRWQRRAYRWPCRQDGWRRSCRRADRRCSGCDYCRRYATRLVLLLAETSTLLCALLIRQNFAALIDVGLPTRRYVIATAVLR